MKEEKLIKFLNGRCTPKETEEVSAWLRRPGSEDELKRMMEKSWQENASYTLDRDKYDYLLEKIHHSVLGDPQPLAPGIKWRPLFRMVKVAALFLLLVLSGYVLLEGVNYTMPEEVLSEAPLIRIERSTAAGEKLTVDLRDGSRVKLNSLSRIVFDSDFGITTREIQLEGEAFFEVAPDKDKPFIVKTGKVMTTALGTSFNAYSREVTVRISLTEGLVKVSHEKEELRLDPGEMATLGTSSRGDLFKGKFDPKGSILWKEGKIPFHSRTLNSILKSLEDWYGVSFQVSGELPSDRKVTGVFDNGSLDDILKGLGFSLGFEYRIKDNKVEIKFPKPM
ncbi:MAG: FecR domain-containing protein [Cyclobacteriaceae bacterium]